MMCNKFPMDTLIQALKLHYKAVFYNSTRSMILINLNLTSLNPSNSSDEFSSQYPGHNKS